MNVQEISIRHCALGWMKKAIDDNLSEIQTDLKRYIENNEQGLLDGVKQDLGVVQGVLVMIEQYGAAMLAEEMIALVDFIVAGKDLKDDQALEVLLRAVLQLPDYLEHIQSGHRDNPIAILPLLNDIRAVRNQDLFSEKLLFLPDLSMHEDEAEIEAIDDESNQGSRLLAKKLRPVYQLALVNIIRDRSVKESLKRLEKICETLEERSVSEQIARIWWIVGALIESVARQQLELGVSIKSLLGKVDALFRVILIIGEGGLLKRQPIELIRNFLFYVAQPECDGPKAQAIKTAYRLEQFLPSESARSEVLDNIAGPNQALLKTVAESMKIEIETIKSTLEVYVNGDLSQVDALKDLPKEMHIISDTLAMIGLGAQRQLIEAQIESVKKILAAGQAADEEQLLSMAAELLQVEQALEQMSKRQPNRTEQARTESDVSHDYELDSVLSAVVAAALDDIQKTKTAILEFIKAPERSDNIELCITLMLESRGAMQLLEQQRAVTVVDGLLKYLRGYEVSNFMESERLDSLSQIVVSLEYYLEALGEHRSDANSILDLADIQLQKLLADLSSDVEIEADDQSIVLLKGAADGNLEVTEAAAAQELDYKNIEDTEVLVQGPSIEGLEPSRISISPEPDAKKSDATQVLEPAEEKQWESSADAAVKATQMDATVVMSAEGPGAEKQAISESSGDAKAGNLSGSKSSVTVRDAAEAAASLPAEAFEVVPVNDGAEVLKSGSDAEILEIYLEEAEDEASNIVRLQKDWMLHPEDENALKNIRRAFHTIKGSGRLVGALKIGEFAWDYEQLLNSIIDKTVPPERPVIDAVGKAGKALIELVHELKTFEEPSSDIAYLRGLARALAEFKTEELLLDHTQTMSFAESPYDHITDADESEGDSESVRETGSAGFGVTTQIIDPKPGVVESQDWADADALDGDLAAPQVTRDEVKTEPAASSDIIRYDDTVLTEAPPIPSIDDRRRVEAEVRAKVAAVARARAEVIYQRAPDYSRASEQPEDDDVDSSASPESAEDRPTEDRSAHSPAIEIESMGDDFVGEGLIDSNEAPVMEASLMEAPLAPAAPVESRDLPAIEFAEVTLPGLVQGQTYRLEAGAEEIDMQAFVDEPEAEAIDMLGLEEEAEVEAIEMQGIEMQGLEEEAEAEEIGLQGLEEEAEADEIDLQGIEEEAEAEAIEMQGLEEEVGVEEFEMQGLREVPEVEEFEVQEPEEEAEAAEFEVQDFVGEPETEEIDMPRFEEEPDEIVMQESAEEFEAEEITMKSPVEEFEAEEIVKQMPEKSGVEEIEFATLEDSTGDNVDSSSAEVSPSETNDFETQANREDPPDPFVVTTAGPMPGAAAQDSEPRVQGQLESTVLSFDPELLTIYQQEVEQHLDTVSSALDHAEKIGELIPGEEIYRALHTIHGASRTADITTIGELAALLEKPLKSAIAQNMALDHEIVALYRDGKRALHEMTA